MATLTTFIWDGDDLLNERIEGANAARYAVLDGEVLSEKRGASRYRFVPDPLGSVRALLDTSGSIVATRDYWPYGEVAAQSGSMTALQFVGALGYFTDTTNRVYIRARHYRPDLGRWVTEDPIGLDGGDWNVYRYAGGAPIRAVDPAGTIRVTGCDPRTAAELADVARQMCAHFQMADRNGTWPAVARCYECRIPGGRQMLPGPEPGCFRHWCDWGEIRCDNRPNCPSCGRHACACTRVGRASITICTGKAFTSPGVWNWGECSCGASRGTAYRPCRSPWCEGRQGFFYLLHELQHACGIGGGVQDALADWAACCILDQLFAYPPLGAA